MQPQMNTDKHRCNGTPLRRFVYELLSQLYPAPSMNCWRSCTPLRLFAILLLCAGTAIASTEQINAALQRAIALEAKKDFTSAIYIYRGLYIQHPHRADLLMRLESALSRAGRHDEVAALLRQRLSSVPNDNNARLRLGLALFELGQIDSAAASWEPLLQKATTTYPFAVIADRYRKRNLDKRAEQTYRRARTALKKTTLFARELAEVAERRAHYPDAVREYLIWTQQNPQYRAHVEARLRDMAQNGDQHAEVFDLLSSPKDQTDLSLLIEYALPAGFVAQTLDLLLSPSAPTDNNWNYLFRIAHYSLDNDNPTTAIAAYRAICDRADRSDHLARAQLGLGKAYQLANRPTDAQTHYSDLITHYPNRAEADEARFLVGLILRDHHNDAAGAQKAFQNLIQTHRRSTWRYKALFALAEGHLQANSIDKTRLIYHQIIAERATASEATEARFRLAELHFLSGQIDRAQTLLNAVLKTDVNRDIINDTIALSALLQEGQRADATLLSAYASACLKLRQKDQNGALHAFETLHHAHPKSFLADRLLDHQAKIYTDQKRYPQAIQTYRKLIATQPESPLSPAAYIAQGAIYDKYLGQYYDAQKIYETLLVNYPTSLEADIARERLRSLRQKIQTLEKTKEAG